MLLELKAQIVLVLIVIYHFGSGSATEERLEPGWARFCGKSGSGKTVHQDIFTNECPAGGWFDNSSDISWNCVCTMGTWAVRFSWCKPEEPVEGLGTGGFARFTPTDLTCFRVSQQVSKGQKVQGVHRMHKWWDRNQEDLPYIWTKVSGGTILSEADLDSELVGNVSVRHGVTTMYALRANAKPHTYFSIYNGATRKALCLVPPTTRKTILSYPLDYLWAGDSNETTRMDLFMRRGCQLRSESNFQFKTVVGSSLQDYVIPPLNPAELHPDCQSCLGPKSPFEDVAEDDPYSSEMDEINTIWLQREIDGQSERLVNYWIDHMLHQGSTEPELDQLQELVLLRKAAIMSYRACNMNYIPRQFYQFFLILFKALIRESFHKYPPQPPLETDQYETIVSILNSCMRKTEGYDIRVDPTTCPPQYSEYFKNDSGNYIPIEIPPHLMAVPGKHDYIVEFAWKLSMFLQYHCHEYFQQHPVLQNALQVQLEGLLSEDIQRRWTNPSHSLGMLDDFFKTQLDVVTAMSNFERCIAVSNKISAHKGWLQRPIDQRNENAPSYPLPRKKRWVAEKPMHKLSEVSDQKFDHQRPHDVSADYNSATTALQVDTADVRFTSLNQLQGNENKNLPRKRRRRVAGSRNFKYGIFQGESKFACLLSTTDFSAKNPSYSLRTNGCFDEPLNDLT